MIGRLAERRELRMKQEIFRGLYEENLRIVGRTSARQFVRARAPRWARAAASAASFGAVLLFTGTSLTPTVFPEQSTHAGFFVPAPAPAVPPPAAAVPERAPSLDPGLFRGEPGLPLSSRMGLGVRTILLDPGHGGADAGAIGHGGTREKDVTLDIVRRLKRRLDADGRFEVILSREDDSTLPLEDRVSLAHAARADLFLSVHLNFLPRKPINIIETFYAGPGADARSVDLARRENAGSAYGMSDFRQLVERMGRELKIEESKGLAASIQASLFRNSRRGDAGVLDYGVKRAPFVVLMGVEVPAVLAEVSCLSNADEEARLASADHREDIAAYLETGIRDYLRNGETTHESKK